MPSEEGMIECKSPSALDQNIFFRPKVPIWLITVALKLYSALEEWAENEWRDRTGASGKRLPNDKCVLASTNTIKLLNVSISYCSAFGSIICVCILRFTVHDHQQFDAKHHLLTRSSSSDFHLISFVLTNFDGHDTTNNFMTFSMQRLLYLNHNLLFVDFWPISAISAISKFEYNSKYDIIDPN